MQPRSSDQDVRKGNRWHRLKRWFRYKYLQLFRAKGGVHMVAAGFSIGIFVEMFTLPTYGLAFFLIFPLAYLLRGSVASALLGFVFGKVVYIPFAFMHSKVGGWIVPNKLQGELGFLPHWLERIVYMNLKLVVGGMIDGAIMAAVLYFPIRWLLVLFAARRKERRRLRKSEVPTVNAKLDEG